MNPVSLVYLDHVTKNYGHEVALMDVSLNIQPGRIIWPFGGPIVYAYHLIG